MKYWLTIFFMAWAVMARAQSVTLAWDPSPSPGVTGYRIYFGTNAGSYSFVTNAGLVQTQTVALPHTGRWIFAATAVDANGLESDFSNEAVWEARPLAPIVKSEPWFRLWPELWHSTNQIDWVSFKGEPTWVAATNAAEFFTMRGLLIERVQRVDQP
jgi:hypothetical protein